MFDWQPYVNFELTTTSDVGNEYYITPIDDEDKEGPWSCYAVMIDGTNYAPKVLENRRRAEAYAEELEVQYETA